MAQLKRSKNQLRRERAKRKKIDEKDQPVFSATGSKNHDSGSSRDAMLSGENIDIQIDKSIENNPLFEEYKDVISKYTNYDSGNETKENGYKGGEQSSIASKGDYSDEDKSNSDSDYATDENRLSKKELRRLNKVSLASLKASTRRPQVVEWFDVDARDPYILTNIKSSVNVVQVPEHWSSKRPYLSSRRGMEKQPFKLPKFILDTGIQDMRNSETKTLKEQQRERVQPKMGKLDIDYQKLHDAFFRFQTKPRLYGFGDVYFEGREITDENDKAISKIKPGCVSSKLREALALPPNDTSTMPPWITIMHELGKPPAYSSFSIPGLDTEYNNKGYVAVGFGSTSSQTEENWGKLLNYELSSEEEDEEDEDESENFEKNDDDEQLNEDENSEGNMEEPQKISLSEVSKFTASNSAPALTPNDPSSSSQKLYTVLKEESDESGSGLIKSEHKYKLKERNTAGNPKPAEIKSPDESKTESTVETFKF